MEKKKILTPVVLKDMSRWRYFLDKLKEKRDRKLEYQRTLRDLKVTTKINNNELISDLRHFRPSFWNRVKGRFFPTSVCLCIIHYPQGIDVIRYFPMPKPFMVDINNKLYLFSPKAFRYMNGLPKLEFYLNIPFAILHNVTDKYTPPSLDADAFSSVQRSKFIQDAATIKDDINVNGLMIAVIIVAALAFVMGVINLTYILQILKHFPK